MKQVRVTIIAAAVAALGLLPAAAQAQVTLGQLAPANPPASCTAGPYDMVPTGVTSGNSYVVPPGGGAITSWSTNAAAGVGQQLKFKVYRPLNGGAFLVVGHDLRTLNQSSLNTFPVSIPVQAGDVIGLDDMNAETVPNACSFTAPLGNTLTVMKGDAPDGGAVTAEETQVLSRANVTATLLPPPVITSISPASGPFTGGTHVIISGSNFAQVQSVTFGGAAASFSVSSESQIDAVTPSSPNFGTVAVRVTTAAGAGDSIQSFAYTGCTVPKLTGKKLKVARKALTKAGCALGKVRGKKTRTTKVVKQSPKAGTPVEYGTKVNVKLKG